MAMLHVRRRRLLVIWLDLLWLDRMHEVLDGEHDRRLVPSVREEASE
jgi:hypothetical protein